MTASFRAGVFRLVMLALLASTACVAHAQSPYPSQPIRLIVPFPPAGGTDTVARFIADKIHAGSGASFIVDNRPGAGGNIGLDVVAKAAPDGYTLGMAQTANLAINPSLYPRMPYDALRDIAPVALVAGQPMVVVVRTESPWHTLKDLIDAGKAAPRTITMGSPGNGTVGHLTGELFARQAGFTLVHVPYRGANQALTDLMGGQIDFYLSTPQSVIGSLKAAKLRALAVSSAKRLPALGDVPTIAESGFPGFDVTDWKMLVAPAGTPDAVLRKLHDDVQAALSRPETAGQLEAEGSIALKGSQADAVRFVKSENERWGKVVRDAGVKID